MKPKKFAAKHGVLVQQAIALHQSGRLAEAAVLFRKLLKLYPAHPVFLAALGTLAVQTGDCRQGEQLLARSLQIAPQQPDALFNYAIALSGLQRYQDALACYDRVLALRPDYAEAHVNRGNILKDLERYAEAADSYGRAIALQPGFAEAYNNRGTVLQHLGWYEVGLADFERAIALRPEYGEAYFNRGNVLQDLQRYAEAPACYERAIALEPRVAEYYLNLAMLKLLLGDFEGGWSLYEWRWQVWQADGNGQMPGELWLGRQSLTGKTLLVSLEQGLGDFMQFCRYAVRLEAMGANVILQAPDSLVRLASGLGRQVTVVVRDRPLPAYDLYCPLMSLPLACQTTLETIPADVPYLYADAEKQAEWRQRLGGKTTARIGLVWSGGRKHLHDCWRSIPLALLEGLLSLPFEFHALQKEIRETDESLAGNFARLRIHSPDLHDFTDTAALLAEMDLVIAVDTSVAHLAGAMGKPVWILLQCRPDFRWLLDRTDCPWYPTARLFRQAAPGEWANVLAAVVEACRSLPAG